ncbi:hypothetical protein NC652_001421 [Populus alba x Populus x berolinensis]|nr:hypothetical protein NC652_001421 [Populus alba x Populus x berolinensis]
MHCHVVGVQFLFFMGSIRELMGIWFKGTWTERLGLCRIMVAMGCLMSNSSKLQNMLEIPATLAIDSLGEDCRHTSSINRFFGILCLDAYSDIYVNLFRISDTMRNLWVLCYFNCYCCFRRYFR